MQWFITNRLSVDLKKTCFMVLKQKLILFLVLIRYHHNGVDIAEVNHAKFIGVSVDDNCVPEDYK